MENQGTTGMEKSSTLTTPKPRSKRSRGAPVWVANLIMLALGIIIGFMGHWLIASGATPSGTSGFDGIVSKTRHFRGNANAPVTIIEFSDFQ
jgi:ABC-type xylose transport system permease subunit